MKKELIQTSLDQTGIAIYINTEGKEKRIPLFSETPIQEAKEILDSMNKCMKLGAYEIKNVFITNNLLDYKITDAIKDFIDKQGGDFKSIEDVALPQELVHELATGFPFIIGLNPKYSISRLL